MANSRRAVGEVTNGDGRGLASACACEELLGGRVFGCELEGF
ncbi:MAG TPA: hypothetical protein VF360_00230 [Candidatus Methanoperedens sp.]